MAAISVAFKWENILDNFFHRLLLVHNLNMVQVIYFRSIRFRGSNQMGKVKHL